MKRSITVLSAIILLLFSCSEKEPTAPPDDEPTEVLAEATIGTSGGELKTDDFLLIVPEGAFSSDNNLRLLESQEEAFEENSVSDAYRVEGLPDNYTLPLEIRIKYNGALSEENFIVVGEEGMDAETGDPTLLYDFIIPSDSSGYLVGQLQPNGNISTAKFSELEKQKNEGKWVLIRAKSNYLSSGCLKFYYNIYLPKTNVSYKPEIVTYLDGAFQFANELRFETRWTSTIYLTNLAEDAYCKFCWKNAVGNKEAKSCFTINHNKLNDLAIMKIKIGGEVLRLSLFQYDPQYPIMVGPSQQNHHWLNQAVITWSEEKFVPTSEQENYTPINFKGNEIAPLNGMHAGIFVGSSHPIVNAANHGNGMSSFIKYLENDHGIKILKNIYESIRKGAHPVDAIKSTSQINNDINSAWSTFLNDYLTGEIYQVESSKFLSNIDKSEDIFTIEDKNDTLKTFSRSYGAFSTKLFQIDLKNQDIMKNANLHLKLKQQNRVGNILVYGLKDDKLLRIGEGIEVAVGNLEQYNSLIAAVVKLGDQAPYTDITNLDLEIRVNQEKNSFENCNIQLRVAGVLDTMKNDWERRWLTVGQFVNNVYTGTISSEQHGGNNATGTIRIEVDNNFNIISLDVIAYNHTDNWSSEWGCTAKNVPATTNEFNGVYYQYSGNIVCSYIQSIYSKYTDSFDTIEYSQFVCDENSDLFIRFY